MGLEVHRLETWRPITDADVPDADFVIATWWETAEWVNRLAASKGRKLYLIQHHEVFSYVPADRVKATYRMNLHKIVVAGWLKDLMAREYGDTDVDLVPNAVDHKQFYAPARTRQPVPTVGLMYSITGFKAIHVAVAALRRLKSARPDLKVICFSHQQPQGLEFLGADVECHLSPSQDVIRQCYSSCDAWLTSSSSEGFNLPSLEAMACRTPVVSTRAGWPATAIVDGYNGYLAPIDDADALYDGLVRVLDSPNWELLSQNAHATAAELTWERSYELLIRAMQRAHSSLPA